MSERARSAPPLTVGRLLWIFPPSSLFGAASVRADGNDTGNTVDIDDIYDVDWLGGFDGSERCGKCE